MTDSTTEYEEPYIVNENGDHFFDAYFLVRRQMAREAFAMYKRGAMNKESLLAYAKQIGVVFKESELK